MPPWKQLRSGLGSSDDNWESRAVALAAQLDQAAEELRSLAEQIRMNSLGGAEEENDERPES
jgi:hypothetical protein